MKMIRKKKKMIKRCFDDACYHCGENGHRIEDCHERKNTEKKMKKQKKL